jgi:tetratricopeptide (TPR) repeat protein
MPHKYYIDALLASGLRELASGHFASAENAFRRMLDYPPAIGHSKPLICNEAIAYYHLGLVAEAVGKNEQARAWWQVAATQDFPHAHHWVSYRENEYFGALAALRLGEPSDPDGANLSQRRSGVLPLFPETFKGQDAASTPPGSLELPFPANHIADRLIEGYNPQAQPAGLDLPMFAQGWRNNLAAARGFQLLGKPAEAGHALDLAERAWGPSWVLKHTRNSLAPSYSTHANEAAS